MKDKRTFHSFLITLLIISFIYVSVTADANTRSMGFGGEIPDYPSFAQEIIHSNDATEYLYENKDAIYGRVKRVLSPGTDAILALLEDAAANFDNLIKGKEENITFAKQVISML